MSNNTTAWRTFPKGAIIALRVSSVMLGDRLPTYSLQSSGNSSPGRILPLRAGAPKPGLSKLLLPPNPPPPPPLPPPLLEKGKAAEHSSIEQLSPALYCRAETAEKVSRARTFLYSAANPRGPCGCMQGLGDMAYALTWRSTQNSCRPVSGPLPRSL